MAVSTSLRPARALRWGALALATIALATTQRPSMAAHESDETCDAAPDEGTVARGGGRKGPSYEVLPEVSLPTRVEDKIKALADRYKRRTGKSLVVTSGTRDAASQAEVIFDKLEHGDDIVKLYKNKTASLELVHVYQLAKGQKRDRSSTVAQLTETIRTQMKKGVFISAHLRAGAADVRSTDMTTTDKRHFVDAVQEVGGLSVMLEATPAHFHMQLEQQ